MRIRDPIYGDLEFSKDELKLINSKSFDRLRRIKQLSFTEYVYPGAVHTRAMHSLGVCEAVTRMFDSVQSKTKFFREGDRDLIRLIALSHDLGHAPFSHAGERLSDITHEERMVEILELEKDNIVLDNNYGIEGWNLVSQTYLGEGEEFAEDPILYVLRLFMDSAIDADKIDYLYRDAYFCGLKYGEFDRDTLINSLTLIRSESGFNLGIEDWGLQALESFILARYYMFNQVYYHPTHRLYDILYVSEMKKILKEGVFPSDIKKYLAYDDSKVVSRLKFLCDTGFDLVYDSDYNANVRKAVDSKLGDCLVIDTPRRDILQKIGSGENKLLVHGSQSNQVLSALDISPVLKSLQGVSIHKLRYYAPHESADKIRKEIQKIAKEATK